VLRAQIVIEFGTENPSGERRIKGMREKLQGSLFGKGFQNGHRTGGHFFGHGASRYKKKTKSHSISLVRKSKKGRAGGGIPKRGDCTRGQLTHQDDQR